MQHERDTERQDRLATQQAERKKAAARRERFSDLRNRLAALFKQEDPYARGAGLVVLLSDLFKYDEVSIRDAFAFRDEVGVTHEQFDGVRASVFDVDHAAVRVHHEQLARETGVLQTLIEVV